MCSRIRTGRSCSCTQNSRCSTNHYDPARADLYFGAGNDAGRIAGRIRQQGRFVMLLPRELDMIEAGKAMPLPRPKPTPAAEPDKDKPEADKSAAGENGQPKTEGKGKGKKAPAAKRPETKSKQKRSS